MKKLNAINPFTGELYKSYPVEQIDSIEKKVLQARDSQLVWSNTLLKDRVRLVQGALEYFEYHRGEIANDISLQMGRPAHQAKGEISGLLQRGRYMCEIAEQALGSDVIEDSDNFYRAIEHSPLGLIFVISAWNFPLLITINSVVPALLAGNTVLLKHSSTTPEIGVHFEKAFGTLGGHSHLLQNVIVNHETTGKIIEEMAIDHVVFTGSVSGGHKIQEHAAKKFLTPQLELGGKDGAYIDENVNLEYAVDSVVDGAMFNSGQSCCGIERVYVHKAVYDQFLEAAKKVISGYKLGDPSVETTSMGPMSNPKSVDFMLNQINQAKDMGAQVLLGGTDLTIGKARFMEPTLIEGANPSMDLIKEENFGPILPVVNVGNMEEAIELINDSKYGLTSPILLTT